VSPDQDEQCGFKNKINVSNIVYNTDTELLDLKVSYCSTRLHFINKNSTLKPKYRISVFSVRNEQFSVRWRKYGIKELANLFN